jgi:hypothetical protein
MARLVAGVVVLSLPIIAWGVWAVVMGGPAVLAGAAVGFLIGACILLAWGLIGLAVAAIRFFLTPPATPPAGTPCAECIELQELWDSMSWLEKAASLGNFVVSATICWATGCGGLNLVF